MIPIDNPCGTPYDGTLMIFEILEGFNRFVGGYILLALLIPAGVIFTFATGFVQIRHFKHILDVVRGKFDSESSKGEISHFRALNTALAGTVGTGNIVGVALAIYYGGPGALFWMWLTGFFGMATKFVECTLSHAFRAETIDGEYYGGPMHYIKEGLKPKIGKAAYVLAFIFTVATLVTAFADAMTQFNSMSEGLKESYAMPTVLTGGIFTVLMFLIVVGGIKRIGSFSSKILPTIGSIYAICALVIVLTNFSELPEALSLIFKGAFTGTGATGGFIGSTFLFTAMKGVQRGLFSNEAGAGSAAMAHGAAKTDEPVREGLVASVGPLIDTLFICTLTGLTIIISGAWKSGTKGVGMTIEAFQIGTGISMFDWINTHIVPMTLLFFAFTTALAYAYYGETALFYFIRHKDKNSFWQKYSKNIYFTLVCLFGFLGTQISVGKVWTFIDASYSLMAIPNLIAILVLFPRVRGLYKDYKNKYLK